MEKENTLAAQYIYWPEIDNKFQQNISFGQNSVESFQKITVTKTEPKKINVVTALIEFYALNDLLAKERKTEGNFLTPLALSFYKDYQSITNELSKNIFNYMFMICLMEIRHSYDFSMIKELEEEALKGKIPKNIAEAKRINDQLNMVSSEFLSKKYGIFFHNDEILHKFITVHKFIREYIYEHGTYENDNDHSIINKSILFNLKKIGNLTLEEVLIFAKLIFDHNNFEPGYGGKLWSDIAQHALNFCQGKINAEVFVDQSFSLQHNAGHIFNKKVIFENVEIFSYDVNHFWTYKNSSKSIEANRAIEESYFFLELQHRGQILSTLQNINLQSKTLINLEKNSSACWDQEILSIVNKKNQNTCIDEHFSSIQKFIKNLQKVVKKHIKSSNVLKKILAQTSTIDITISLGEILGHNGTHYANKGEQDALFFKSVEKTIEQGFLQQENKSIKKQKLDQDFIFEFYDIKNIPAEKCSKELLGSKAFGLNEMHKMGINVPGALVWPCENSMSFFKNPVQWGQDFFKNITKIEDYFINKNNEPILCSIRSGASISMPGMMDTILNVGIDDSNYSFFVNKFGEEKAQQLAIRFMRMFSKSYLNEDIIGVEGLRQASDKFKIILEKNKIVHNKQSIFPLSKRLQIAASISAIFQSWNSERAKLYRKVNQIDNTLGTAAIIQHMVFGNLNDNSSTGVIFSRDCISGQKGLIGEYLPQAQGEDVVSGSVTPLNINELKKINKQVYEQLEKISEQLELSTGQIQDIEFTIEDNQIYILQHRNAVCSGQAKLSLLIERLEKNEIEINEFIEQLDATIMLSPTTIKTNQEEDYRGLSASPGVISGIIIKNKEDIEKFKEKAIKENIGLIFCAQQTLPEHLDLMIKTQGFITEKGGFTSHAAIIARSWQKPCIVGIKNINEINPGEIVTLDAALGKIWKNKQSIQWGSKLQNQTLEYILNKAKIDMEMYKQLHVQAVEKINNQICWMFFGEKTNLIQKPASTIHSLNEYAILSMGRAKQGRKTTV